MREAAAFLRRAAQGNVPVGAGILEVSLAQQKSIQGPRAGIGKAIREHHLILPRNGPCFQRLSRPLGNVTSRSTLGKSFIREDNLQNPPFKSPGQPRTSRPQKGSPGDILVWTGISTTPASQHNTHSCPWPMWQTGEAFVWGQGCGSHPSAPGGWGRHWGPRGRWSGAQVLWSLGVLLHLLPTQGLQPAAHSQLHGLQPLCVQLPQQQQDGSQDVPAPVAARSISG